MHAVENLARFEKQLPIYWVKVEELLVNVLVNNLVFLFKGFRINDFLLDVVYQVFLFIEKLLQL